MPVLFVHEVSIISPKICLLAFIKPNHEASEDPSGTVRRFNVRISNKKDVMGEGIRIWPIHKPSPGLSRNVTFESFMTLLAF